MCRLIAIWQRWRQPVRASHLNVPQTLEELAINQSLVLDLMLRRLLLDGYSSLTALGERLKLSVSVISGVFQHMRQQQLLEIKGMMGNDYTFCLSGAGRALASERFAVTQYAGPCPVSLKEYRSATLAQAAHLSINSGGSKTRMRIS